ncbi:MAG: hypothetical protein IH595_10515 [Bacteroidales bacterium]|nr:hypothetical protein [Bacteroidales bacterium]
MIIAVIASVNSNPEPTTQNQKVSKATIDSIVSLVRHDKLFEIKDVYYNEKDSSFNIAFTNKGNVIKDGNYSPKYFDNTYHLDSFPCFEGIYLFAYQKGKSLKNGDYKNYLTCESKRAYRILQIFKGKYCYGNKCLPLIDYLKKDMNDPSSYESDRLWITWAYDSSFNVTNTFRAKNAFGAKVLNKCSAVIDIHGNVSDFSLEK